MPKHTKYPRNQLHQAINQAGSTIPEHDNDLGTGRKLMVCRRGHVTEVADLEEPAEFAVWTDLTPGAPIRPIKSGITLDPAKTCVHCVNEWLAEEFKMEPVTEPEVIAAYRLGGFSAAVACIQGLRASSVEDALERMALMKGGPLTDAERKAIKEVMGSGQ